MRISTCRFAWLIATIISLPAFSARLPDYYPDVFDRVGVVDRIDTANLFIVMNDTKIHITPDMHVYTTNSRSGSLQSLRPGMKIGFGTTGERGSSGGVVTEVWVLPSDYSPAQNGDKTALTGSKSRD